MKTKSFITLGAILILTIFWLFTPDLAAQGGSNFITINGVVKDKRSKKKLEYVNISIPGTNIGTVTNSNGEFTIKVKDSLNAKQIEFSHVGYLNSRLPIQRKNMLNEEILLTTNTNVLSEVVISVADPKELVEAAMRKIEVNYSSNSTLLTGFYRETVQKGKRYIAITEAVVDVHKTTYDKGIEDDRVRIFKGRKLLSPKQSDTLAVKLLGGPNLSIFADIVKNKDFILNAETLSYYKFKQEESVMIDEQSHFVVSFEPSVIIPDALYSGKLYINQRNMAFARVEVSLGMDDKHKVTQAILKKKPAKLRFKPEEVSFVITYKQRNNITYLSYIRNQIRFKCDWNRRLFPTSYTVMSEMVVTDLKEQKISPIPSKMAFSQDQSLSDKVSSFYDPNFWEDYNIIEPTESLESAVNKLKKQ